MAGCLTCRERKVKCDGRPDMCQRCEKLRLHCRWHGSPRSARDEGSVSNSSELTQAGHKRLRISIACETCRKKKLKCDALKPACSICMRKELTCQYATSGRRRRDPTVPVLDSYNSEQMALQSSDPGSRRLADDSQNLDVTTRDPAREDRINEGQHTTSSPLANRSDAGETASGRTDDIGVVTPGPGSTLGWELRPLPTPAGSELLPYIDSFLENVHPISCNNFLHPGSVCEALHRAPHLLVLAICGSSAKFMSGANNQSDGRRWVDEAKSLTMKSLDGISTLTMSAIQFLVLHEMHEANYTSAWNLAGIAARMSLQLRLHELVSPGTFLQQECRRRLMWAVFVSDLLFDCDKSNVNPDLLLDLPLPCNLWSFTQGLPCKTLTLRQLRGRVDDTAIKQSSNHCAYVINIIMIRRKVLNYVRQVQDFEAGLPWLGGSYFQSLCEELDIWRRNLPTNYAFIERHMYTFRVSRHLDIFLMIHAYYHQCFCLLYGAFVPENAFCIIGKFATPAPPAFLHDCASQSFSHARDITALIQRVLKVESEHVFRDPWFGLCIWDSTCALLTASQRQDDGTPFREDIAGLLQLNLTALANTRTKILLAEKIYRSCCARIRRYGLENLIDLNEEETRHVTFSHDQYGIADDLAIRYPFFAPMKSEESSGWENLFHGTNGTGSAADTRDSSPAPTREAQSQAGTAPSAPELSQGLPHMDEMPYLDESSMQILYPWLVEDFSWQQNQQADIDPAAAVAIIGMMHSGPVSEPAQAQQIDFSGREAFITQPVLGHMESFERQYRQT